MKTSTSTPALNIDILDLIQQRAGITLDNHEKPSHHWKDGVEYHSNCPWCGGQNRFAIYPEVGRYTCKLRSSGCGRHGDAIQFLRDYEGLTFHQACQELDIDPRYPEESRALPLFMTRDEPPNQKWMEAAEAFIWRAERYLWSKGGKQALEYLQSRGLSEETIKSARLGFCPGWYSERLAHWGLTKQQVEFDEEIKIPEGIAIPWIVENRIWKISVRRPDHTYFQVLGSSDTLYNTDTLRPGEPVALHESEIDALSTQQGAGDLITCIATGGSSKGLTLRWISKLKQASHVLLVFDLDEAGENGAHEWIQKLGNERATRWIPWSHDTNDMLQRHYPVRIWIALGLKAIAIVEED